MKKILLFAVAATMFAACSTDTADNINIPPDNGLPYDVLRVSIGGEEESRVQLDESCHTVWNEGDMVSVFNKTNGNECWKFDGNTGDRVGTLSKVSGSAGAMNADKVIALYPYEPNCTIDGNTITTSIPAIQTYKAGSFGDGGNIMVAVGKDSDLSFKNVFGWIRLSLSDFNEHKVQSIIISGNNNEKLAGNANIDAGTKSIDLYDNTTSSVTLDCGEGVQLSMVPVDFYIAVVPQTFERGVHITVVYTDGSVFEKSTSKSVSVARNHIADMGARTTEIPNSQIWYTTVDGEPVNIDPRGFGAEFVSNTYENGRGIIQFDGDITTIPYVGFRDTDTKERLTSIIIPESVTSIGDAFSYCSSMRSITIPASVTSIGSSAFFDCTGECIINCNIPDVANWFVGSEFTSIIIGDGVTSIGDYAFHISGEQLTNITIGRRVKYIGRSAFSGCGSLATVRIPDSVTYIGDYAFNGCSGLVDIGNGVMFIGEGAFYNCTRLETIRIPDVTSIGDWAFSGCSGLVSVDIGNSVTSIGKDAFYGCSSLATVRIPASVTYIGDNAFSGCDSLTEVYIFDIGKWCTIKGSFSFANAHNLYLNGELVENLVIPDDVTTIGDYAFYYCSSLKSVTISDNVTSIGDWAFFICDNITDVTIGSSVTNIGRSSFENDYNIRTIRSKATVPPVTNTFFGNIFQCVLYVPLGCKDAYAVTYPWQYAQRIEEVVF